MVCGCVCVQSILIVGEGGEINLYLYVYLRFIFVCLFSLNWNGILKSDLSEYMY
ncbi:hypothetical protein BDV34DRAFT_196724 [Aspergillus parasiticus]|uniref:Uncharacterized protein n=1 Tax=Aspergillus parasiticus TaxID=5067 RepID=A0A5N6DI99_ASPPA|nr:hypothetical protein BDV34DRAFT_196724 [Aspergillus parasiticus]